MNRIKQLLILLFSSQSSFGHTVGYSPSVTGGTFIDLVNDAVENKLIDMTTFTHWRDFEVLNADYQNQIYGISGRPNLSDYYFIIPPAKRFATDLGIAYLALSTPFNYHAIEIKIEAEEASGNMDDYPAPHPSGNFRYIIYLRQNGYLVQEKLGELEFQELMKKHEVEVSEPDAYRIDRQKFVNLVNEEYRAANPLEEDVSIKFEAGKSSDIVDAQIDSQEKLNEISAEESPNYLPWVIGIVSLISVIGIILRYRNNA